MVCAICDVELEVAISLAGHTLCLKHANRINLQRTERGCRGWRPHGGRGPSVPQVLTTRWKLRVMERDGWRCRYCARRLNPTTGTVDHVKPLSQGGARTRLDNLVAACRDCQQRKGGRTPQQAGMVLCGSGA